MSSDFQVHLANRKQFSAPAGLSLLDAARNAGLVLEHSCRTGRCGSCRGRLRSGRVRELLPDQCLSADERAQGWVLSCAVEAASDLELALEDLGPLAELRLLTLPARIASLQRPAPDVCVLALRLPPTAAFRYLPGQYVNVIGPSGQRRSYSIANAPRADGGLELHVRRVEGGALSAYWFETAQVGELLRFEGPRGSFFLRDVADVDLILLATGTGIAPIKALLEELAQRPAAAQPRSLRLLWGGRRRADLYWTPPALPGLQYTPVLSRAEADWRGARGHVQDVLLAGRPALDAARVYGCGSNAMIEAARQQLCAAGLPRQHFFSDAFVSA